MFFTMLPIADISAHFLYPKLGSFSNVYTTSGILLIGTQTFIGLIQMQCSPSKQPLHVGTSYIHDMRFYSNVTPSFKLPLHPIFRPKHGAWLKSHQDF